LIPAARAFAARWLLQRNENPALLQPIGKTYGQPAFDAIAAAIPAYLREYGSGFIDRVRKITRCQEIPIAFERGRLALQEIPS
jgi:hypothetical protein